MRFSFYSVAIAIMIALFLPMPVLHVVWSFGNVFYILILAIVSLLLLGVVASVLIDAQMRRKEHISRGSKFVKLPQNSLLIISLSMFMIQYTAMVVVRTESIFFVAVLVVVCVLSLASVVFFLIDARRRHCETEISKNKNKD